MTTIRPERSDSLGDVPALPPSKVPTLEAFAAAMRAAAAANAAGPAGPRPGGAALPAAGAPWGDALRHRAAADMDHLISQLPGSRPTSDRVRARIEAAKATRTDSRLAVPNRLEAHVAEVLIGLGYRVLQFAQTYGDTRPGTVRDKEGRLHRFRNQPRIEIDIMVVTKALDRRGQPFRILVEVKHLETWDTPVKRQVSKLHADAQANPSRVPIVLYAPRLAVPDDGIAVPALAKRGAILVRTDEELAEAMRTIIAQHGVRLPGVEMP